HPSYLYSERVIHKLFAMTEGYTGELAKLLCDAAVEAIRTGEEKITLEILDKLESDAPSERKLQMDKVLGF
ncbi:MAG: AAA family ATPase, partial [Thiomicrospira sp.]